MNYGDWEKTALDKPVNALEQISIMANQTFDKVMKDPIPQMIIKEVNQKMDVIKKELHEDFQKIDAVTQGVMTRSKEKLNEWLKQKMEIIILKIVDKMKPHLLNQMIDPCMCEFVKNFIRDIYEELWPDIRDQILIQIRMKFDNPYENIQIIKPKTNCLCVPFAALRSWYLYAVQPFNRSIFYRLKTVSWWFILLIKLIPFYGIQSFIYLVVFLFIDKKDEYQLVQFIINFKSMQFVSIGILGSIIGYFTFYGCTVANDLSLNYQECQTKGPAIFLNFYLDIIGYLLQIALTFIAFFLLPFSEVKGRIIVDKQLLNKSQENKNYCFCFKIDPTRGGRLKFFMIYDLICFISCIGLFLALFYTDREEWQYKASMYLVKTIYGVLSFPFLIFIIPGIIFIITRSHGTGYDQYGNCLPLIQDLKFYNTQLKKKNQTYDPLYVADKDESMDIYEGLQLMEEIL